MNPSATAWKGMKFRHKARYWAMRALAPIGLADFEPEFYARMNPDIAATGLDPLLHWVVRGRKESRLCSSKQMSAVKDVWQLGGLADQAGKPTVLLVSHEASRTGAPILCLSLARQLQDRFNVVTLLLKDGPLTPHFKKASTRLAVAEGHQGHDLRSVMWSLNAQNFKVDVAIVNCIVSYPVLAYLKHLQVPSLMLIHEYAAYCKPSYMFDHVVQFSGKIVFSAPSTKSNAVDEIGDLPILTQSLVLPQGQCVAEIEPRDSAEAAQEQALIADVLGKGADGTALVVVGAGSVNIRKGVDVFIQCAALMRKKAPDGRFKFVWVGGGYDSEKDLAYSVYLKEQIKRSGLSDSFQFLSEVANIQAVYDRTDVFLLTSRLDPLPNVGIDAICNGLPIFCFQNASGIADILVQEGYADELVAPYLDADAMASQVLAVARTHEQRQALKQRLQHTAHKVFSMERYTQAIGDEAEALLSSRA
ncbi:MAG: glycosyltransferase [Aquabacterium sp.]|jgi:glycosyltransferase involved in cell wall biosynthesis|uniref:glycosyltransferase n=1 Tax=Aquabacterium sp. TaxID=1872578 RepID=UPI003BB0E050